jgi:O-acetylhomoserine (thiol)-lyase
VRRFPEFTEPNEGYHGLYEALGAAAFIAKVRIEGLRDYGAALSPFNAFKLFKDLKH